VKVNGVWRYVYRAIDQYGQVFDVLVSTRPDAAAARRFFIRALRMLKVIPSEVVTDAAPVYPAVLEELVPAAWHHVEQYANSALTCVNVGGRYWDRTSDLSGVNGALSR
jgi:transposase-like protein